MEAAAEFNITLKESFGPVHLGMSSKEVEDILKIKPDIHGEYHTYKIYNLKIGYRDDSAVFIEMWKDPRTRAMYKDKNLFELTDHEITELFADICIPDEDSSDCELSFSDIQINFWREVSPDDLKPELDTLEAAHEDYELMKNAILEDIEKIDKLSSKGIIRPGLKFMNDR